MTPARGPLKWLARSAGPTQRGILTDLVEGLLGPTPERQQRARAVWCWRLNWATISPYRRFLGRHVGVDDALEESTFPNTDALCNHIPESKNLHCMMFTSSLASMLPCTFPRTTTHGHRYPPTLPVAANHILKQSFSAACKVTRLRGAADIQPSRLPNWRSLATARIVGLR
jgi:hypothetical protein